MDRSRSRLTPFDALTVKDRELGRRLDKAVNSDRSLPDWIAPTFQNAWVNFGGAEDVAGYWRNSAGIVFLKGVIKTGAIPSVAFTLPVGLRPLVQKRLVVNSNGAFGSVLVGANGTVTVEVGNNVKVDLSSVSFRAEQ